MSTSLATEVFREFDAFSALSDDDLLVLANRATVEPVKKRQVLFSHGDEDPWIYCLMEGSLQLTAADGVSHRLDAGTPAAKQPVSRLTPRMYTAAAMTPVRVLKLDSSDLGDWQRYLCDSASAAHEISLEEISGDHIFEQGGFEFTTEDAAGESSYELPSLPTVALEASRVVDADDSGVDTIARLVNNDPAIAAKLIKAANSPVFYARDPIATCERAIVRLGLKTTRQLIMAFAMRDLFKCEIPEIQQRMEALWQHSVETAAIAFVLSRKHKLFDAGEAQLAGLLHDIGRVSVLSAAAKVDGQDMCDATRAATCDEIVRSAARDGARVGAILLEDWNFPPALVAAAREAEQWWRDDESEPELADLVLIAHGMSMIGKPQFVVVPPLVRLPAFRKVFGEHTSPDAVLELLAEAEDEVSAVKALLSA